MQVIRKVIPKNIADWISQDKNYESDASKEVEKAGVVGSGSESEEYTEQEGASGL